MVLQPLLKVSVSDALVYDVGVSVGPSLIWWEPWPQNAPPSAKLRQDLAPRKVIIYVYKDVLGLYLSSRGPPPLAILIECCLLDRVDKSIFYMIFIILLFIKIVSFPLLLLI